MVHRSVRRIVGNGGKEGHWNKVEQLFVTPPEGGVAFDTQSESLESVNIVVRSKHCLDVVQILGYPLEQNILRNIGLELVVVHSIRYEPGTPVKEIIVDLGFV
uniref:Uncharacterized protein n=1 Tax=Cacopsylla melanoneura TaxID=428564 RepID=A0A8D8ZA50_9HEMI